MRYYYREHLAGYRKVREEGKTAWGEIHGASCFEDFSSRGFLEAVLPRLGFSVYRPVALECGCGTGPGACFLAKRGFRVDGIDLVPEAIEMAREEARKRGLRIHYEATDVCRLPHTGRQYDVILDSYCLQCIVTDADRKSVFAAVRARLKPDGYYLVSSAMFDRGRLSDVRVGDSRRGVVYNRYGENGLIDMSTGIALVRLDEGPGDYEDAIEIGGEWYLPSRRHLEAAALRRELEEEGFEVLYQDEGYGGNLIAVLEGSGARLH